MENDKFGISLKYPFESMVISWSDYMMIFVFISAILLTTKFSLMINKLAIFPSYLYDLNLFDKIENFRFG
jgi:hypothetical protein